MKRKDVTGTFELVRRAKGGERDALEKLMLRYYDRVRRIIHLRLGSRLRESVDTADILQQTFLTAIQRFGEFEMRDEASLINWLARLAERQITGASDYFNAQKRDRRREVALDAPTPDKSGSGGAWELADDAVTPVDRVALEEERRLVESCIKELPETYRELIILRNYAGCTWKLVAQETGRPSEAAARMMHAKAMLELSKLLQSHRERGSAP